MMNDEMQQFESRLSRQPLAKIPADWRSEILTAARAAQPVRRSTSANRQDWLADVKHQLATVFWPNPKAWAGLAAVWVFIFMLNASTREPATFAAEKNSPPSPEVIVELKIQHRMFAELVGVYDTPDVDRHKSFSPKPRSARVEMLAG